MPAGTSHSVIAVAGRRIDAADAQTSRFPFKNASAVRSALLRMFEDASPLLVVGLAACGSDLLALDAALGYGHPNQSRASVLPRDFSRNISR
jgi:hypothetical protein